MSEPPAELGIAEYQRLLQTSQRTVMWALDEANGPWDLEPGETPATGEDWFFIVNFPRTGSSVAQEILSRHTDIHCSHEDHILPLLMTVLHSRMLIAPELWFSVRYLKKVPVTPANVRALMDGWRKCVSDKRIFGDKGEMYYQHFGDACSQVFPGCKFVLTVRNPLDTLSSYIHQPWAGYMRGDGSRGAFFEQMRGRASEMLISNTAWRDRAAVIEFEQLTSEAAFRSTFTRVFTHLGADPTAYDWEEGWAMCHHQRGFGRWKRDGDVLEFMNWLETRDDRLHRLLATGVYFLEGTADRPDGSVGL